MPRGVKKPIDEQIEQIDQKVQFHKEKIDILHAKRSQLLAEKRDEELFELYKLMEEKGLAPDEVISIIQKNG